MPPAAPKGRTQPRLFTKPLRRLTRGTTLGYECIEFAEQILGVTLLPWQRWWLLHALEVDENGLFRYRTILTLIARQNGKTHLLKIIALWMMYLGRARLVLGSAQSLDIAREAWQGAVDLAQADSELASEIDRIRYANGEQELRLTNGARYRIAAATGSAGRGLSVDLPILDELRQHTSWAAWGALSKTTLARPNALTVAISNAGSDESIVLNALRDNALSGKDTSLGIFEWSAEEGCDLDDRRSWAQANPGLGHVITERAIAAALGTDPPATFRTECLCQRVVTMDAAIDMAAWRACADPAGSLEGARGRVVLALDVAPQLDHVTLAAAAVQGDGRVRTEVVAAWESTKAARDELPGWIDRIRPKTTVWIPSGPAAAIAGYLKTRKRMTEIKTTEVGPVCQGFAEQVAAGQLVHNNDPLIGTQLAGAVRLYSGDGWRFARRGVDHVDAVYASAAAAYIARMRAARPRPVLVVGQRAS